MMSFDVDKLSTDKTIKITYIPRIELNDGNIPTKYLYFIFLYLFIIIIWTTGTILCLVHPMFKELACYMIVLLVMIILSPCGGYLFIIFLYWIDFPAIDLCR